MSQLNAALKAFKSYVHTTLASSGLTDGQLYVVRKVLDMLLGTPMMLCERLAPVLDRARTKPGGGEMLRLMGLEEVFLAAAALLQVPDFDRSRIERSTALAPNV